MYLDEQTGAKKQGLKFDPSKVIVNILIHEMYIIVVYESSISIYNSANGDFLEERGKLEKQFKYKYSAVNFSGNDVYVVTHNSSSSKNIV